MNSSPFCMVAAVLALLLQGCFLLQGEKHQEAESHDDLRLENFSLENIVFESDRNKVLVIDLSNPDARRYSDIDYIFWPNTVKNPWRDDELSRVAKETIYRNLRGLGDSEQRTVCSGVPTVNIKIISQEYVTDGKASRPTDFYALRVRAEVSTNGQHPASEVLTGEATAQRHTCWGTVSFSPIRPRDVYGVFSEALNRALCHAIGKQQTRVN